METSLYFSTTLYITYSISSCSLSIEYLFLSSLDSFSLSGLPCGDGVSNSEGLERICELGELAANTIDPSHTKATVGNTTPKQVGRFSFFFLQFTFTTLNSNQQQVCLNFSRNALLENTCSNPTQQKTTELKQDKLVSTLLGTYM